MNFVEVKEDKMYFADRPLVLRGLGIGTWMNIEHFMVGLPGPQSMILSSMDDIYGEGKGEAFLNTYIDDFISADDFDFLNEQGINFVRVPINYRLFFG